MSLNHPMMDRLLFVLTPGILAAYGTWNIFQNEQIVQQARSRAMQLAMADDEDDVAERYGSSNHYAQGTSVWVRAFNNLQQSRRLIFDTFPFALLTAIAGSFCVPKETLVPTLAYCSCSQAFLNGLADPQRSVEANETERRNLQMFRQGIYLSLSMMTCLGFYSMVSFVADRGFLSFLTEQGIGIVQFALQAVLGWAEPSRKPTSSTLNRSSRASSNVSAPQLFSGNYAY